LRRCIDQAERLSSVNDGARWIGRIMLTNFPHAVQIVDWHHASGRLWTVGQSLYGEGSKQTREWVGKHLDDLWQGKGWAVVGDLQSPAYRRVALLLSLARAKEKAAVGPAKDADPSGGLSLAEVERQHIQNVLAQMSGDASKAAQVLGVDKTTLDEKIRLYGLEASRE
jgi:uncharacterized protein with beta-barrel porin domain